ncbi:MAG TPA: glycerate kinase [Ramlibacter sp.]|jgi:hypothetical protein|uniref:glycerate kinase n=1 Tax=Ramlibacter sp. TaxID=1917967 RepID=UPI002D5495BC|nr:glycerate kinase [Ramlibacter sp.]HZY17323.1 glycerate kinase [Ramlibacter sp.]
MTFQRILVPIAGAALVVFAWRAYGWAGVALVGGGILMWILLHFTRLTQVLKRASDRPIGWVDSAVMLNARLKPNLTLLHVIGLARALGEQLSPKDEQPEIFRWTDGSASHVTCEFAAGKLVKWTLERPAPQPADALEAGR